MKAETRSRSAKSTRVIVRFTLNLPQLFEPRGTGKSKKEKSIKREFFHRLSWSSRFLHSIKRTIFWSLAECQKLSFASYRAALFVLQWPWTFLVVFSAFFRQLVSWKTIPSATTNEKLFFYFFFDARESAASNIRGRHRSIIGNFSRLPFRDLENSPLCSAKYFIDLFWQSFFFISHHESQFYA